MRRVVQAGLKAGEPPNACEGVRQASDRETPAPTPAHPGTDLRLAGPCPFPDQAPSWLCSAWVLLGGGHLMGPWLLGACSEPGAQDRLEDALEPSVDP